MAEGLIISEGWMASEDGTNLVPRLPLVFWQHPVSQTIPTAIWTPFAWNTLTNLVGPGWTRYVPASTTIAAGSNGAVLPQGTINVASTTGFKAATATDLGYIVIRIGGTDRVVAYTGTNATQFTGCTFGVGTMTTGDAVAQANVEFSMPAYAIGTVGPLVASVAWASNATGGRWIRLRAINAFSPGIHLNAATGYSSAVASADPLIRSACQEQPAFVGLTKPYRVEVHQTSGGNLDAPVDQLADPRLVVQALSSL